MRTQECLRSNLRSNLRRAVIAAVAASLIFGSALTPASAADPPPPDWQTVSSVTTDAGITATWEAATSNYSVFDGSEFLSAAPAYRPNVLNGSDHTIYVGIGTDLETPGVINQLWRASDWGAFASIIDEANIDGVFATAIAPGDDFSANQWFHGVPSWSGHTVALYELDGPFDAATPPTATLLLSITTPGRFVGANLGSANLENLSAAMGSRLTLSSGGSAPELFAGVATSVSASGLTPGETLELWAVKEGNYAYFQILGGALPVNAISLGSATVSNDGSLHAFIVLPESMRSSGSNIPYQLVAGVSSERYWPAGTWDDFVVRDPPNLHAIALDSSGTGAVTLGTTTLGLSFGSGAGPSEVTVTTTPTGPDPFGFTLASDPPLYYHLTASQPLNGSATVCFSSPDLPVPTPHLFHFDTSLLEWRDITVSIDPGRVCGETTNFSPFALGYPESGSFTFSGYFDPVSNDSLNVAKAGQAIPVIFSLGGAQGPDVVASAKFVRTGTDANPVGEVVDAVTSGKSGLQYDAATGRYTYVWKTEKAWAKLKGEFVLTLSDGSEHRFTVTFKK